MKSTGKIGRTKRNIIKVAHKLFAQISVHKTTMNDIAEAANISRRTLYTHFKSKDELYNYVVIYETDIINGKLQKVGDSQLPPDRKLKLYILTRFNVIDNLVKQNRFVRYDFIFNSLRVQQQRKSIDIKEIRLLTDILSAGQKQNIFRISDPATLARTMLIMFKSLEQPFILLNNRNRNYYTLQEYVELLFHGIINNNR